MTQALGAKSSGASVKRQVKQTDTDALLESTRYKGTCTSATLLHSLNALLHHHADLWKPSNLYAVKRNLLTKLAETWQACLLELLYIYTCVRRASQTTA